MISLPLYLAHRSFARVNDFVRHWYAGGFRILGHHTVALLAFLDRRVALYITFRHLLEPLYQDHTIIGHTLGFVFRSLRLLLGGLLFTIVIVIAIATYLAWAALPPYIFFKILSSLPAVSA